MQQSFLDAIDGRVLFVLTAVVLMIASELGFRAAYKLGNPHQESQAGVVTAALLGILGLLLAFSFGIVEGRFSARKALVVDEANAIEATYLRARMIPEPAGARVRLLLRAYIEAKLGERVTMGSPSVLDEFERMQADLWSEATRVTVQNPQSVPVGLFVYGLNQVIAVHNQRVTVVLYQRLPVAMLITLYVVASFALALHGYSAGLVRVRVPLPAIGLIISLSSVLFLIVELDRPWQSVFHISQNPLMTARKAMTP